MQRGEDENIHEREEFCEQIKKKTRKTFTSRRINIYTLLIPLPHMIYILVYHISPHTPHMRTHIFYITTSRSLLYYLLNYILPVNRLFSGSYTSHMLLQQSAHGKLHAMHMRTHLVHLQPRQ